MPRHVCGGQSTACRSSFLPSAWFCGRVSSRLLSCLPGWLSRKLLVILWSLPPTSVLQTLSTPLAVPLQGLNSVHQAVKASSYPPSYLCAISRLFNDPVKKKMMYYPERSLNLTRTCAGALWQNSLPSLCQGLGLITRATNPKPDKQGDCTRVKCLMALIF